MASKTEVTLGDIFTIKRGLATGANDFFILTEEQVKFWKIPRAFVKPILPGPRYVTESIIETLPNGAPKISPSLYLLDSGESEERIKAQWPRFYEYLEQGKAQKIDSLYLASRRAPWYMQEHRPPAPFLCTYMGRARDGNSPFRFIWNKSQATAHNVYLMLYPKGQLRDVVGLHPEFEADVFKALQSITATQFLSEGRIYGGGLHKLEPKELGQIPASSILDALKFVVPIEQQIPLFE